LATPFQIREAARTLLAGGLVAYPTEAVYGLGCDPLNHHAVFDLLTLKQRPVEKGLILIASDFEQLHPYLLPLSKKIERRINLSWPGPTTWLLPARPEVPHWLRGCHQTLAVRVTAHPTAAALCDRFGGAIISTSANSSSRPPARKPLTLKHYFAQQLDYTLHAPLGELGQPTEIRDAISGELIRPGG